MARTSKKVKFFVGERSKFCCEYCLSQEAYSPDYFSIEHTTPQSIKVENNDVERLRLNRTNVVNLRVVLGMVGKYPPY
jgi:hypothetical protein